MFVVLMYRDIGVSYIRIIMQQSAETMGARSSGKWKAIVQGAAQLIVVAIYAYWGAALSSGAEFAAGAALFIATIVTAYSLVDYAVGAVRALIRSGDSD
jgi:CDP-diacylglycerol---glycerol-3-phosphate 3-phosphatidyltransferase